MKLEVIDSERCVGCQSCMFACSRRTGHSGLSHSCIGVKSAGGMSKGFVIVVCRGCADPPCAKACPQDALVRRSSGGVMLKPALCNGCGNCREACVLSAVYWDDETNKPMICVHCGYCVNFCPHGVLDHNKGDKNG